MKKLKIAILLILVSGSFFILNYTKKDIDYTIKTGNQLSSKSFNNNFLSKMSNQVEQYDMIIPERFEKVSENESISLFLERESMAIAIRNKENGYVWYSYDVSRNYAQEIEEKTISEEMANQIRSGVHLNTYNVFTPGLRTLLDQDLLDNKLVTISYDITTKGFIAHIDFTKIKIKFDVVVEIDNEDLVVSVPRETINEYDPKLWDPGNKDVSINNILIYPYLGSTKQQENGYIVIPDGSGAIVSLSETPKHELSYSAPVYGKDLGYLKEPEITSLKVLTIKPLERVTLPIFGIIHDVGNAGLLVISESGANYATYNYVSKGQTIEYYQSYFHYSYRTDYTQNQSRVDQGRAITDFQEVPNQFELKQRYVFLSKEDADYVGVAKNYRKFLEERNQFNQVTEGPTYETKIDIIGNEVERGLFWNKNVATTTYEEAVDLIRTIKSDGYENLDVSYKTFDLKSYSYLFDVYRHLGGKNDFNDMMNYFNENDIDFNYYIDYVNNYNNNKYSASKMNRQALTKINYSYMFLYSYTNDAKYLPEFVSDDYAEFSKYNIDSLALSGLDSILYTHKDKNRDTRYSTENMEYVDEMMSYLKDHNININLYNPDSYLYQYTNKYYDAPLSSSELMFIDATIPLVELVVSGHMELYSPYLNFISSEDNTLLRLVEYGINPSYILTSKNTYELKYTNSSDIYVSQYDTLKQRMDRYDSFIKEALNEISGIEMVNHYFYKPGVAVSEYANGKTVIVNYTDEAIQFENLTIEAKGYDVI